MRAKSQNYNLTEGSILNKLLIIAIPIMGTQLMQMAYNLTDIFWLSKVQSDYVAASGTAGMYLWLSNGLMMVGRVGSEVGVSQSIGQGDQQSAKQFSQNSFMLAVLLGTFLGILMILFRSPLIGFFNMQDAHVARNAEIYLAITAAAIPAAYITAALTGTFNGAGNSKIPFYINTVGLIANMVLDPILIITFEMGIVGAAVATSVGQFLVALLFLSAIKIHKARPFDKYEFISKFNREKIRQIVQWSWPTSLESILFSSLTMINTRIVAQWGTGPVTVQKIVSQIESMAWLIGGGFASAVTAFVGQNFGAKKWSRIHKCFRISIGSMVVWGLVVTCVMLFGARFLVSIFLDEPELIEIGVTYLHFLAVCQIIGCVEYNCQGAFRGIGKTLPPSIASIGGNAIRVPLVYFLSKTSLGLNGIWLGLSLGALIRSLWMCIWFWLMARRLPKSDGAALI